jgi:hypothetical protein
MLSGGQANTSPIVSMIISGDLVHPPSRHPALYRVEVPCTLNGVESAPQARELSKPTDQSPQLFNTTQSIQPPI